MEMRELSCEIADSTAPKKHNCNTVAVHESLEKYTFECQSTSKIKAIKVYFLKEESEYPVIAVVCREDGHVSVWDVESKKLLFFKSLDLSDIPDNSLEVIEVPAEKYDGPIVFVTGNNNLSGKQCLFVWQPFSTVAKKVKQIELEHEICCLSLFLPPSPESYISLTNPSLTTAKPMLLSGGCGGSVCYWDLLALQPVELIDVGMMYASDMEVDLQMGATEKDISVLCVVPCTPLHKVFVYCGMKNGLICRWMYKVPGDEVPGDEVPGVQDHDKDDRKLLKGHTSCVTALCVHDHMAKEWYLMSGSENGDILMWDMDACVALRLFSLHTDMITSLGMHYDALTGHPVVVSSSLDRTIHYDDVLSGNSIRVVKCISEVRCLQVYSEHESKSKIFYGCGKTLQSQCLIVGNMPLSFQWELKNVSVTCSGNTNDGHTMVFAAIGGSAFCFDGNSSKLITKFCGGHVENGVQHNIHTMVFVALSSPFVESTCEVSEILITCSDTSICTWNCTRTGVKGLKIPEGRVDMSCLKRFCCKDNGHEHIACMALKTFPVICYVDDTHNVNMADLWAGTSVRVVDDGVSCRREKVKRKVRAVTCTAGCEVGDGYLLFCGFEDGYILCYNIGTIIDDRGLQVYVFRTPYYLIGHTSAISCLLIHQSTKLSSGGTFVISGSDDCTVRVWCANGFSQLVCVHKHDRMPGSGGGVRAICVVPHPLEDNLNEYVCSGGADGVIFVCDLNTGEVVRRLDGDLRGDRHSNWTNRPPITSMCFVNSTKWVLCSSTKELDDGEEDNQIDDIELSVHSLLSTDQHTLKSWNPFVSGVPLREELNSAFCHDIRFLGIKKTRGSVLTKVKDVDKGEGADTFGHFPKTTVCGDKSPTFDSIELLVKQNRPKLFFPMYGAHLFAEAAERLLWNFVAKFLPLSPMVLLCKASYCRSLTDKKTRVSLLAEAVATRHHSFVVIILEAWISLLNVRPVDGYAQNHLPSEELAKDELLLLANVYPEDFSMFICKLKPLPVDETVMTPYSRYPMGSMRFVLNFSNVSENNYNMWGKFFSSADGAKFDTAESTMVAAHFIPLCHCADRDMLAAYINVCNLIGNKKIMDSVVGQMSARFAWRAYGHHHHQTTMIIYWGFIFVFCLAQYTYGTLSDSDSNVYREFVRLLQVIVAAYTIFLCYVAFFQFRNSKQYFSEHFLGNIWNTLSWATAIVIFTGSLFHIYSLDDNSVEAQVLLSFGSILAFNKTLYYLRAYQTTGPLLGMLIQIIKDIKPFLAVLGVVVVGFSVCFWILCNANSDLPFSTIDGSLLHSFSFLLGNFDPDSFAGAKVESLAIFFSVWYMLLVCIIMLNLLIALMGSTYATVQKEVKGQYRWEQVSSTLEQMNLLSSSHLLTHSQEFFPKTIHYICRCTPADDVRIDETGVVVPCGDNEIMKKKLSYLDSKLTYMDESNIESNKLMEKKVKSLEDKIDLLISLVQQAPSAPAEDTKKKTRRFFS